MLAQQLAYVPIFSGHVVDLQSAGQKLGCGTDLKRCNDFRKKMFEFSGNVMNHFQWFKEVFVLGVAWPKSRGRAIRSWRGEGKGRLVLETSEQSRVTQNAECHVSLNLNAANDQNVAFSGCLGFVFELM